MKYPKRSRWVIAFLNNKTNEYHRSILYRRIHNLKRRSIKYQIEVLECLLDHILETQPNEKEIAEYLGNFLSIISDKMKWYFTFSIDVISRHDPKYPYICSLHKECMFKHSDYRNKFYDYLAEQLHSEETKHIYKEAYSTWKKHNSKSKHKCQFK